MQMVDLYVWGAVLAPQNEDANSGPAIFGGVLVTGTQVVDVHVWGRGTKDG
jgi:hypothetical protein